MALPTKKPLVWAGAGQRPRLLGRYHVLDEIGRNAVGPLYLARLEGPKGFQRWAAIRRVDKRHVTEDGYVARFYERVREGAKLLHPNVTALFDVGEDDGAPWVAMEYLHGERIEEAIGRLEFADTPASWEIAARVIADAADGLHAVHNLRDKEGAPLGLLHGDLAPHSLVVTYEGKTKIKGAFEPRVHGVLDPRKVPYAAPEQLFDGAVDARADVFALGVLLWELLAGKRLFARRTDDETRAMIEAGVVPPLVDLVEDIPMELDALVRRALTRSSSQRFSSARELSRELESLLVSKGVVARDDDVGRYMRTLFADRYSDQEARLHAAADVTEVFRRSQQSPTARALSAIAAIPDVSVKDEEDEGEQTMLMDTSAQDDDHTTAERPASKPISGYTDEILADSGPTNPRAAPPLAPLNDTDEIPTMTAPQPSFVMEPKTTPRRKDTDDELTLTAPKIDPGSSASRLIMPSSLTSDPDVTESAIFVAPRIPAPTPPDTEAMVPQPPPPRPMMPSFPERPLLPSTPPTGVHAHDRAHIRPFDLAPWPPPPPPPPPFTPPPAFHTSRGPHAALSTSSLRAVLFPRDRARRVAVVSIVGSIGGALLFLAFFFVWRSLDQRVATTPASSALPTTPSSASAHPSATASTSAPSASARTSAAPPVTVPQIPTLDLSQPATHPRGGHRNSTASTTTTSTTTATTTTSTAATSAAKTTGFLTVMCKPASCDHILDGARDLGGSPLYKQEMSTGKHVLTLRVDTTHVQKTVTVDVADGETVTIRPDVSP